MSPVATRPSTSWLSSLRAPAAVGLAGTGLLVLLRLRDPHGSGSYGLCPSLVLTGLPCPGCGGLRAVNDLTRGDVGAAVGSNLVAVLLVAGLGALWLVWAVRRWSGRPDPTVVPSARWGLVALAALVVFGVVRNLPIGAGLAP